MKKALIPIVAVALVAFPAAASAHHPRPLVKSAAHYCKSLRSDMGVDAFRQTYGGGGRSAFGKCVVQRVHELRAARRAARQSCRQQLGTSSLRRHGKGSSRRAFRQCVRQTVRTETGDDADGVTNAAKTCAAERESDQAAFEDKYGTNHNKRNAFGKCVSQHADDSTTEPGAGNGGDTQAPQA